ncbi:MAG: hypothetical protein AVDCRST_MAG68-4562, partial [uncultured Gemmatimonadetes bacterium]
AESRCGRGRSARASSTARRPRSAPVAADQLRPAGPAQDVGQLQRVRHGGQAHPPPGRDRPGAGRCGGGAARVRELPAPGPAPGAAELFRRRFRRRRAPPGGPGRAARGDGPRPQRTPVLWRGPPRVPPPGGEGSPGARASAGGAHLARAWRVPGSSLALRAQRRARPRLRGPARRGDRPHRTVQRVPVAGALAGGGGGVPGRLGAHRSVFQGYAGAGARIPVQQPRQRGDAPGAHRRRGGVVRAGSRHLERAPVPAGSRGLPPQHGAPARAAGADGRGIRDLRAGLRAPHHPHAAGGDRGGHRGAAAAAGARDAGGGVGARGRGARHRRRFALPAGALLPQPGQHRPFEGRRRRVHPVREGAGDRPRQGVHVPRSRDAGRLRRAAPADRRGGRGPGVPGAGLRDVRRAGRRQGPGPRRGSARPAHRRIFALGRRRL